MLCFYSVYYMLHKVICCVVVTKNSFKVLITFSQFKIKYLY